MTAMDGAARLFAIKGYHQDFYAGLTDDGRQVLMGLLIPNLVAYFFAQDGTLLGRERRALAHAAPQIGDNAQNKAFRDHVMGQLSHWKQEIGFHPQTIYVRAFTGLGDDYIGVEEVPESLSVPDEDEDAKERELREHVLRKWIDEGNFVLIWSGDYHMSREGDVEST